MFSFVEEIHYERKKTGMIPLSDTFFNPGLIYTPGNGCIGLNRQLPNFWFKPKRIFKMPFFRWIGQVPCWSCHSTQTKVWQHFYRGSHQPSFPGNFSEERTRKWSRKRLNFRLFSIVKLVSYHMVKMITYIF